MQVLVLDPESPLSVLLLLFVIVADISILVSVIGSNNDDNNQQ